MGSFGKSGATRRVLRASRPKASKWAAPRSVRCRVLKYFSAAQNLTSVSIGGPSRRIDGHRPRPVRITHGPNTDEMFANCLCHQLSPSLVLRIERGRRGVVGVAVLDRMPARAYQHDQREHDQHDIDQPLFGFSRHRRHRTSRATAAPHKLVRQASPARAVCAPAALISQAFHKATDVPRGNSRRRSLLELIPRLCLTECHGTLLKKRSPEWNLVQCAPPPRIARPAARVSRHGTAIPSCLRASVPMCLSVIQTLSLSKGRIDSARMSALSEFLPPVPPFPLDCPVKIGRSRLGGRLLPPITSLAPKFLQNHNSVEPGKKYL